jgi:hypothetical protein
MVPLCRRRPEPATWRVGQPRSRAAQACVAVATAVNAPAAARCVRRAIGGSGALKNRPWEGAQRRWPAASHCPPARCRGRCMGACVAARYPDLCVRACGRWLAHRRCPRPCASASPVVVGPVHAWQAWIGNARWLNGDAAGSARPRSAIFAKVYYIRFTVAAVFARPTGENVGTSGNHSGAVPVMAPGRAASRPRSRRCVLRRGWRNA